MSIVSSNLFNNIYHRKLISVRQIDKNGPLEYEFIHSVPSLDGWSIDFYFKIKTVL